MQNQPADGEWHAGLWAAESVDSKELKPLTEAAELCQEFVRSSGYGFFFFSFRFQLVPLKPSVFALTNYPKAWLELYRRRSYVRIDPIVQRLKTAISPFTWAAVCEDDPAIQELFSEAKTHGLDGGVCFPIYGPRGSHAAFTMSGGKVPAPGKSRDAQFATAILFGQRIFEDVLRTISEQSEASGALQLTLRQQQILTGTAEGLSYQAIGERYKIKVSSVKTTLDRCCEKLGVATREEAIVRAMASGQIHPLTFPSSLGLHRDSSQSNICERRKRHSFSQ